MRRAALEHDDTIADSIYHLSCLIACGVQPARAEPAVISVLRADKARLAAMMAGDGDALGRLMSDQLRFVHSDGRVESKTDYVKNMMAGDTAYADAKTSELETMQISPDVVVVLGVQEMRKRLGPAWSDIKLRYLAVWRNESGMAHGCLAIGAAIRQQHGAEEEVGTQAQFTVSRARACAVVPAPGGLRPGPAGDAGRLRGSRWHRRCGASARKRA
jgi:hypothetical protein